MTEGLSVIVKYLSTVQVCNSQVGIFITILFFNLLKNVTEYIHTHTHTIELLYKVIIHRHIQTGIQVEPCHTLDLHIHTHHL